MMRYFQRRGNHVGHKCDSQTLCYIVILLSNIAIHYDISVQIIVSRRKINGYIYR